VRGDKVLTRSEMSRYIDSTLLRPDATAEEIRRLCEEAARYRFFAVCVNPGRLELAARCLEAEEVKLCTVVGFPLGANATVIKVKEAETAMEAGATELDAVMNIGLFKDGNYRAVEEEVQGLARLVHDRGGILKIIIETGYLNPEEIRLATRLVAAGGADFVKTCTGFGPRGVAGDDIIYIRSSAPPSLKIKASGGIESYQQALGLIELGADRIGTSHARSIISELMEI